MDILCVIVCIMGGEEVTFSLNKTWLCRGLRSMISSQDKDELI